MVVVEQARPKTGLRAMEVWAFWGLSGEVPFRRGKRWDLDGMSRKRGWLRWRERRKREKVCLLWSMMRVGKGGARRRCGVR